MRPEERSVTERGEASGVGRCEVCGADGPLVIVADLPPPSRLCEKCATEYDAALLEADEPSA
ncbi:MAG: hypothetical protein QM765_48675 [Myxococcales bacterium]